MTGTDLAEAKATELRDAVTSGQFRPGQQLNEQQLSAMLQISRNTLRESFRILMHDGLLVRRPHRGVFVRDVTVSSTLDLYRVRRVIQPAILAESHPLGHPGMAQGLEALELADASIASEDWDGVGTANMAFHRALVSLSDSPRLIGYFDRLVAEIRLVFVAIGDAQQVHVPFVDRNRAIADLLLAERTAEAATEMESYLEYSERTMVGSLMRADATD